MFPVWLPWEEEGARDLDLRRIPGKGFWWASPVWILVGLGFSHQCRRALEAAFGKLIADCLHFCGQPVSGQGKGQLQCQECWCRLWGWPPVWRCIQACDPPPLSSPSTRTELCIPCSLGMTASRGGAT